MQGAAGVKSKAKEETAVGAGTIGLCARDPGLGRGVMMGVYVQDLMRLDNGAFLFSAADIDIYPRYSTVVHSCGRFWTCWVRVESVGVAHSEQCSRIWLPSHGFPPSSSVLLIDRCVPVSSCSMQKNALLASLESENRVDA